MQRRIRQKWRPPLALVLTCTFGFILCLPLAGIVMARLVDPGVRLSEAVNLMAVPVIIVAIIVGWVLRRILLRPITTLAARADAIRTGEAAALDPLDHYGTSEMEALGRAMREMGQTLQTREVVQRSYADHVTHELKSPLSALQGAAELLGDDDLSSEDRARLAGNVRAATARMTQLLDAQRALARAHEPMAPGQCQVATCLPDPLPDGLDVSVQGDGNVPINAQVMRLVLEHVLSNAAAHRATRVDITVAPDLVVIADNGPGVSQGNRSRIFEPFFTTRRDSGGTGMGLAIVRRMLESQGATITLGAGPGARFEINF